MITEGVTKLIQTLPHHSKKKKMAGQNGSYSMLGIKNATIEIASLAHLMIKNKKR